MKKLLLLLTVIALCGCNYKPEETINHLIGNMYVGSLFLNEDNEPYDEKYKDTLYFISDARLILYSNLMHGKYRYKDTVNYNIFNTDKDCQHFIMGGRYKADSLYIGTLYLSGERENQIRIKLVGSSDDYPPFLFRKQ
jgi:hypothetical protein